MGVYIEQTRCQIFTSSAAGKLKVLPQINLTPEMHVAFNTLHVAGMLRVTLTPIMQVRSNSRAALSCTLVMTSTACRVW